MNKVLIVILSCTLFSCSKAEKEIFNLHGGRIFVIGHGGAGFETAFNYLPENSLGSIERCIVALSSDGVEVDVQLTQDNELVLYHDKRLETQTNCQGCIRTKNSSEVLECRFTQNFVTAVLTEEKIISLHSILERYTSRNPRPKIFLDVKLFDECYDFTNIDSLIDIYTQSILNLIVEFNNHEDVYVESASVQFLKRMKDKAPGLKYLVDASFFESSLDSIISNNFYGIVIENNKITREQVKLAHDQNVNVVIFNTRSRNSNLEAVNKHPDYIQTDEIILLQQILMNK